MKLARPAALLVLGVVVAGLAGCNNVPKKRYDDLASEATQLRERNQQVERQLADAETEKMRLQQELDGVRANAATVTDGSAAGMIGGGGGPGDRVITIAGDVLFTSGSATIKNDAKKILDSVASELNGRYGGNNVRIAGHTDSDPLKKTKDKWTDNENLSAQRALAVERYLASKGVDSRRMYSAGYGSDFPKGSKKDSRRVEIVIIGTGNS